MLNVSQRFKELMKAPVKVVRARIEVEDGTVISAEDNLVSITLESQGQYFLSAARTGKATLLGTSWSSLQGKRLTIYLTAYANAEEQDGEEACYGVYTVRLVEANLEKDMTNIEFDGSITRATNTLYKTSVMVFPMTVAELANSVATQGGLTLITDMTTLPNHDYVITEDLWRNINNATFRDVIDQIAGATATIARVGGADNNLEFVPVNQAPVDNLGYENLKKFQLGDEYGKVSSVVLARTPQEDNIFVEDTATEQSASGINLVRYSDSFRVGNAATGITRTVEEDGTLKVVAESGNGNWHTGWWDERMPTAMPDVENMFNDGDEFTISFTIKKDSGSTGKPTIYIKNGMGYYQMVGTVGEEYSEIYYTGFWRKMNSIQIHIGWSSCVGTFHIKNFMIKKGGYTPYEPYEENGLIEVKLANNEILDDNREAMAQPILDASKGLGYRATELSTEGHGWYEIGDKINLYELGQDMLPDDYQAVEYITGVIGGYIDTQVKMSSAWGYELDFEIVEAYGSFQCLICSRNSYTSGNCAYADFIPSDVLRIRHDNVERSERYYTPVFEAGSRHKVAVQNRDYYLDGVRVFDDTSTTVFTPSGNATIFASRDGTSTTASNFASSAVKLYRAKIWNNSNVIQRDFVPCYRKSDNKVGLFDLVNNRFYANSGTGNFGKGGDITLKRYRNYIGTTAITYQKLEIAGSFRETLKCVLPEESNTDYATAGSIYGSIWNTEIKVDKQGNEITSIVSRQDQFENETRENFTQVVQNIDSVVTTIQTTGGGNAIHNSVGYNKDTDGSLVGWTSTGTVASETSPESLANGALSGNQIDLGVSSSITQRIAVDSSGSVYTLSFRVKKSVVGQAVVHLRNSLDDYTVVLPNGTGYLWEQFEIVGVRPSESYFDLVVETNNAVDYFAITDLMLTVGDSITPWVQATDEILSRNVALDSNGVKVSSNTSNDYVKLDELGLNGYSDAEGTMENVFTINRDMTEVSKLRARKQIEMPPLKVIPIDTNGNSGWAFVKIGDE